MITKNREQPVLKLYVFNDSKEMPVDLINMRYRAYKIAYGGIIVIFISVSSPSPYSILMFLTF